ncbi:hypothetical protein ACVWYQ_001050 [Bradyrhizobium sp. USDA 3397]
MLGPTSAAMDAPMQNALSHKHIATVHGVVFALSGLPLVQQLEQLVRPLKRERHIPLESAMHRIDLFPRRSQITNLVLSGS